jgi:hypothetical protein
MKPADLQPHERFYQHLKERDVAFDIHAEYRSKGTFVGASVQVASAGDLDKLSSAEGVLVSSCRQTLYSRDQREVQLTR